MYGSVYGAHWCSITECRATSQLSPNIRAASLIGTPLKSPGSSPGTRSGWSS
jgi:hypothetical protein